MVILGVETRVRRDRRKEYIFRQVRKEVEATLDDSFSREKEVFYEFANRYVESRIGLYNRRQRVLEGIKQLYQDIYLHYVQLDAQFSSDTCLQFPEDPQKIHFSLYQKLHATWVRMVEVLSFNEVRSYEELLECSAIKSPHQVVCKLGEGRSGATYKVYSPELKQHFALKVIRDKFSSKEAELMARLKGERLEDIVQIYDAGVHIAKVAGEERYAIVMEYVFGMSLEEVIRQEIRPKCFSVFEIYQSLDEDVKQRYFNMAAYLLRGIISLRKKGITHRDLNPRNIIHPLRYSGSSVKILDFGIATDEKQPRQVDARRYGTPDNKAADDLFSYGLILYELFTGRHLVYERRRAHGSRTHAERVYQLKQQMFIRRDLRKKYIERIPYEIRDLIVDCLTGQSIGVIKWKLIELNYQTQYIFMSNNRLIANLYERDAEIFELRRALRLQGKENVETGEDGES